MLNWPTALTYIGVAWAIAYAFSSCMI